MSEENKILAELSDPFSAAATSVANAAAGGVLSGIRESSTDVWGALIGDRLKQWRVRNLSNSLEKTARHIRKKGIELSNAKPLPYGDMIAIFDGMSKIEDDNLSDMWARLLAEEMTSDEKSPIATRTAASVLEQMSADAAKVFLGLARDEKVVQLKEKRSRIRNQEFFPLSENEKSLNDDELKSELDSLIPKVERQWDELLQNGLFSDVQIDLLKDELLRFNLLDAKDSSIFFDGEPFSRGYKVTAGSLDTVLSDLHGRIEDLINDRTNHGRRPFFKEGLSHKQTNFSLNNLGKEIAKKLNLL